MSRPAADRVIVLGIDGLCPRLLEPLMDSGRAPHFARLREQGGYRRLATTTPAQSPVAWSTIATGANPGRHGVYDFIRRDPRRYLPELAVLRPNPRNLLGRRDAMFLPVRGGTAFWTVTTEAGVPTTVIRWPLTLPPEPVSGRMLAGLGVPDLKANLGRYTLYTTRVIPADEAERRKGDVVHLPPGRDALDTHLHGPDRSRVPMQIRVDRPAAAVTLRIAGQEVRVGLRQWSDWVRLRFTVGLLRTAKGLCRFHLTALEPHLELYLSPLQADPREPAFVLSHPDAYASELADAIGDYHTLGLPEDTNALRDNCFDADAFLAQCESVTAERERMLWHEVDRLQDGLLAFVFDTTDRIQHVFWGARDPGHPAADPAFAARYGGVIEDCYLRMDRLLGALLDAVGPDAALLVVSDHGFAAFRRAVHLNAWLADRGFLALKDPAAGGSPALFRNVDWARTQAYAVGFSSLYVNLAGREGHGIVAEGAEAAALRRQLADDLSGLADPATGQCVVARVDARDALYAGPFLNEAPDLVVSLKPGCRISWQTAVGACPQAVLEDNRESWSGDHLVEPACVPGVLFLNRPVPASDAHVHDVAPTILRLLGLPVPGGMDGRSLLDI